MQTYFEGKVTDGGEMFYFGRMKAYFFMKEFLLQNVDNIFLDGDFTLSVLDRLKNTTYINIKQRYSLFTKWLQVLFPEKPAWFEYTLDM